jgi:membrane-bound ClpP family serine protease
MFIAYKIFSSVKSPLILKESLNEEQVDEKLGFFLSKEGIALTPLRPSGTADFDGVRLDVITRGEFVEKGTKVFVEEIKGKKIVVRAKVA